MAKKRVNGIEKMTETEKSRFVFFASKSLDYISTQTKAMNLTVLTFVPICIGLAALVQMNPISAAVIIGLGCGGASIVQTLYNRHQMSKIIKEYSNGKLTYKDYKQLVKSGEIKKMQEKYRIRPEIEDIVEDVKDDEVVESVVAEEKVEDKVVEDKKEDVKTNINPTTKKQETIKIDDNGRDA